ncbi:pyridoxamine 5'-phosphate oxidase family protein [Nocardia brasiliensis]|uniref:Pyridoxamine 5'-phosphate oxidase family protein n=1 Tax=Nocardia brasiliensis TaxID=37326 RepID=A0A6G9XNH4_NOCBR|nr:pyridoxamine 5'-phosphate oxidase family protein [Nocardia brasiliensis]QIS02449.1 pyridoxamine 5'-phosphate oxidase family protein [Nocardia brasiliensis]
MDTKNLADLYSVPALDWANIQAALEQNIPQAPDTGGPNRHTYWLTTIDPDGRPHMTAVGALWHEGTLVFTTGARSRKGRNLARDPRCAVSLSLHDFDLAVEGTASQVTDPAVVAAVAAKYAADGWPAAPDATGLALTAAYSAPSAGSPPWHVYRITAQSATAVSTVDPGGATRWTF